MQNSSKDMMRSSLSTAKNNGATLTCINIDAVEKLRLRVLEKVREDKREALKNPAENEAYFESIAMIEARELGETLPPDAYRVVVNDLLGYGPLNNILTSSRSTEVIIKSYDQVFAEYNGVLIEEKSIRFLGEKHLMAVLDKIAMSAGRRLDRNSPSVDARLPDGTRVQITIPPLSFRGAEANFRRFPRFYDMKELVEMGMLSKEMLDLIKAVMKAGMNIVVTGPMGSGKTTILNGLINLTSQILYPEASVVIYEDIAELNPTHKNVRQYESQPPNIDGRGGVILEDLVQSQMLRKRADLIVLGEMRGGVAHYVLAAMSMGNSVMSTFHAYDAFEAVTRRLPRLCLMHEKSASMGLTGVLDEISYCVDFVIQTAKIEKNHGEVREINRRVVQLAEVLQKADPTTGLMVPDVRVIFEWDGSKAVQVAEPQVFKKKKRWL